jgi:hypothetical protein
MTTDVPTTAVFAVNVVFFGLTVKKQNFLLLLIYINFNFDFLDLHNVFFENYFANELTRSIVFEAI